MGKLEREIRKRMKQSAEPYEVWAQKHSDELAKIAAKQEPQSANVGGAVKAKRRVPNILWLIGAVIILVAIVMTTAILLSNNNHGTKTQPQIPDLSFGDDFVNVSYMTEDEISAIKEEVPQFSNFLITEATKSTHLEDGSLVMYTIRGELETEDDFYLIEARILYNDNFVFLGRTNYRDFEMTQTIGDTKVSSKYVGKDSDDIYQYLLLSENGNTTVYWSLDSYEGLFDEWLEITFA